MSENKNPKEAQASQSPEEKRLATPQEVKVAEGNKSTEYIPDFTTPDDEAAESLANQRTLVRKRDKALLAALGVFVVVLAAIAMIGLLLVKPPKTGTQGQADCEVVRVSGKTPGRIVRFHVKEGDYVHKGDILVSISSKTLDATLERAKSMKRVAQANNQKVNKGTRAEIKKSATNVVEQAKAAEDIARKTYERMENLFQQGVITEQKRDEAKAALDVASAAVRTAQSQQELAMNGAQLEDKAATQGLEAAAQSSVREVEALLEDQVLVAPCDGEVSEIYMHEGELAAMGVPIMTISKLDDMWVSFNVREEKLNDLPLNKEINVTIPALNNRKTKLKVFYVHDMGSYAVWNATKAYGQYDSKTFEVKARPVDELENFRPGMSVLLDD